MNITLAQQVQHIEIARLKEFAALTGHTDVKTYLETTKGPYETTQSTYETLCNTLNLTPLSEKPAHSLKVDSSLDHKNEKIVRDYAATLEWTLAKLKASKDGINLQDLYSSKIEDMPGFVCPKEFRFEKGDLDEKGKQKAHMPGDITLYRVFHALIACGAAEGISPYAQDEFGEKVHTSHLSMNIMKGPNLDKIKTVVIAHTQAYDPDRLDRALATPLRHFTEDWELPRRASIAFLSEHEGQKCAEEAFHLTNAPDAPAEEMGYRGPSLSVGDMVETKPIGGTQKEAHLCISNGWESKEIIEVDFKPRETTLKEFLTKFPDADGPAQEKPKLPTVEFLGKTCTMEFKQYDNRRTAIQLWCDEGPMARATKNIPEIQVDHDEIIVPDYSEYAGMPAALVEGGLGQIVNKFVGPHTTEVKILKVTHPAALAEMEKLNAPTRPKKKRGATEELGMS